MAKMKEAEEMVAENIFENEDAVADTARIEQRKREREQKLKALRFLEIPAIASEKLVGVEFDIIDAVRSRYQDEVNVAFIIALKQDVADFKIGTKLKVAKAFNAFTETYLDYFESFEKGEPVEKMEGYTFVKLETGGKAGNKPIVLRKL